MNGVRTLVFINGSRAAGRGEVCVVTEVTNTFGHNSGEVSSGLKAIAYSQVLQIQAASC